MSRRAADAIVTNLVIERLRRPHAAELSRPHTNGDALDRQIAEHRQRREEVVELLAEGLLSAATARPRLAGIAEALGELESRRSPTLISAEDLVERASGQRGSGDDRLDVAGAVQAHAGVDGDEAFAVVALAVALCAHGLDAGEVLDELHEQEDDQGQQQEGDGSVRKVPYSI